MNGKHWTKKNYIQNEWIVSDIHLNWWNTQNETFDRKKTEKSDFLPLSFGCGTRKKAQQRSERDGVLCISLRMTEKIGQKTNETEIYIGLCEDMHPKLIDLLFLLFSFRTLR